jgi:hypothetical protein
MGDMTDRTGIGGRGTSLARQKRLTDEPVQEGQPPRGDSGLAGWAAKDSEKPLQ